MRITSRYRLIFTSGVEARKWLLRVLRGLRPAFAKMNDADNALRVLSFDFLPPYSTPPDYLKYVRIRSNSSKTEICTICYRGTSSWRRGTL